MPHEPLTQCHLCNRNVHMRFSTDLRRFTHVKMYKMAPSQRSASYSILPIKAYSCRPNLNETPSGHCYSVRIVYEPRCAAEIHQNQYRNWNIPSSGVAERNCLMNDDVPELTTESTTMHVTGPRSAGHTTRRVQTIHSCEATSRWSVPLSVSAPQHLFTDGVQESGLLTVAATAGITAQQQQQTSVVHQSVSAATRTRENVSGR